MQVTKRDVRYEVSSRAYLLRAMSRIAEGSSESLFYAASELRCGIERRMQEYLYAWDHVSKQQKSGWQIAKLGQSLERAFRLGNRVVRWAVHDEVSGSLLICFYHTPVTPQLRARGEKLGDVLHSMKRYRAPDDGWWDTLRTDLVATAEALRVANMLGGPRTWDSRSRFLRCNPAGFDIGSDRRRNGWFEASAVHFINIKFIVGGSACGDVGEGEHFAAFRACSGSGRSAAGRQRRSSTYPPGLPGKLAAACDNPGSGAGAPCCKIPARSQCRPWLRPLSHRH